VATAKIAKHAGVPWNTASAKAVMTGIVQRAAEGPIHAKDAMAICEVMPLYWDWAKPPLCLMCGAGPTNGF